MLDLRHTTFRHGRYTILPTVQRITEDEGTSGESVTLKRYLKKKLSWLHFCTSSRLGSFGSDISTLRTFS